MMMMMMNVILMSATIAQVLERRSSGDAWWSATWWRHVHLANATEPQESKCSWTRLCVDPCQPCTTSASAAHKSVVCGRLSDLICSAAEHGIFSIPAALLERDMKLLKHFVGFW